MKSVDLANDRIFAEVKSRWLMGLDPTTLRQLEEFWAQLSAFTTLAILVPVIVDWLTQKQLVRGLTTGAVK